VVVSATFLVLILILTGCTIPAALPHEPTDATTQEPPQNKTVRLSIASGGVEDAWYPLGNSIGSDVAEHIPNIEMSVRWTSSPADTSSGAHKRFKYHQARRWLRLKRMRERQQQKQAQERQS